MHVLGVAVPLYGVHVLSPGLEHLGCGLWLRHVLLVHLLVVRAIHEIVLYYLLIVFLELFYLLLLCLYLIIQFA